MAEQSKEEQIRDKICDLILKGVEGENDAYIRPWVAIYETMFGKYQSSPEKRPFNAAAGGQQTQSGPQARRV